MVKNSVIIDDDDGHSDGGNDGGDDDDVCFSGQIFAQSIFLALLLTLTPFSPNCLPSLDCHPQHQLESVWHLTYQPQWEEQLGRELR